MLTKIITTFFLGQVAFEHAAEVSKKQLDEARDKAREKAKEYREKVEDYKNTNITTKFENFAKEKVAHLRSCSEPFENACLTISSFLGETADIKSKLATETNG
ncbi:MAG TPA: hypothetical protein V6C97_24605 [Oculatellaceae cyanobacterium]